MEPSAIFVLVIIIGIGVVVAAFVAAKRQREAAVALATRLGMTYHRYDDVGIAGLPHPIFRMGDRRRVDNVVAGSYRGHRLALFDYEYSEDQTDSEGRRTTRTYRFSGVRLELAVRCPATVIRRERFTTKLANALGLGRDIQFEYDEFNRTFEVRSGSQRFAFTLVDTAMMEWLLANGSDLDIQLDGADLVIITGRRSWDRMEALAQTAVAFREQFPRLVWAEYGDATS